jgi:hypothetical protein
MQFVHAASGLGNTFTISTDYGYVLLVGALIAFEILLIGFIFPGRVREEVFSEDFMRKNFGEIHK